MAILSKAGITSGSLIEASHVTQIIDALTSSGSVIDILVTGSFRVAGTTQLGILGTSSQSPLVFNPDTSGESVFYVKNPNGTLTIGTGGNPYAGSDYLTLSPLGLLSLNGNLSTTNAYVTSNLGVGTTNPQAKLVISNNGAQGMEFGYSAILNSNYIESFNRVTNLPADMAYYLGPGTGSHKFYTNGAQRMVINPSGYIGINNVSPEVPLDVVGTSIIRGGNLIISSSYPRLFLTDTDSSSDFSIINDNGALNIYDDTNGASRIFILPNGNVGVNTTNPLYKLSSHATSSGRVIVGNFSNDTNAGSTEVGVRLAHNNADVCSVNLISQRVGPDAGADFYIETADSAGVLTERFRINEDGIALIGNVTANDTFTTNFSSSGTVTIGTPGVNSTSHIQLWPQDASGTAYYINDSASIFNIGSGVFDSGFGTDVLSIANTVGVGIKKNIPNAALDVNGNAVITGSLTTTGTIVGGGDINATAGLSAINGIINIGGTFSTRNAALFSTATTLELVRAGAYPIIFKNGTSTAERMIINNGGNVNINFDSSISSDFDGLYIKNENTLANSSTVSIQGRQVGIRLRHTDGSIKWSIQRSATDDSLRFNDGATDKIYFQNGGTIRAGLTNAQDLGTTSVRWRSIYLNSNPDVVSDLRVKTNITGSSLGLNFINSLNPVQYTFLTGSNEVEVVKTKDPKGKEITVENIIHKPGVRTHFGLIAQEVKAALPENVDFAGWCLSDKDDLNSQQSLKYEQLISPMIKAIQEQQAQIEELKLQVATLISGSI